MQSRTSSSGKSSYTITPVLFGFGGALLGSDQSTCTQNAVTQFHASMTCGNALQLTIIARSCGL